MSSRFVLEAICDRCRKQQILVCAEDYRYTHGPLFSRNVSLSVWSLKADKEISLFSEGSRYDLCGDCVQAIKTFVETPPEESTTPPQQ